MKWIKDPLYGYLRIEDEIIKVLDSPMLQRLRRIKQLSFVNLVYPSANHTRFEHSLGVMHLSGIIAESLGLDKLFYKVCGLLHDVGHGPFSHLSEMVSRIITGKNHEERAREILKENRDFLENFDWKKIFKEISGRGIGIISGDFDADRLDYLSRDAYHTGNPMGISDVFTLIRSMRIFKTRIVLDGKWIGSAESVLLARNFMRRYVYFHKTKLSAESMVLKSILNLIDEGFLDVNDMMRMDDYLMDEILRGDELYQKVLNRRLYKPVSSVRIDIKEYSYKMAKKIEKEIRDLGIEEFTIYPPIFKRKPFGVKTFVLTGGGIKKFSEVSKYFKAVKEYEREIERFYVFVDEKYRTEKIKGKIDEILISYLKR